MNTQTDKRFKNKFNFNRDRFRQNYDHHNILNTRYQSNKYSQMEDDYIDDSEIVDNFTNLAQKFEEFNLKNNLLRGIYGYGFEYPSPIQAKAIPIISAKKDIIAQAQSGTGKTGAFLIGCLQVINESISGCQAIILVHTKELAQQIYDVCCNLAQFLKIKPVLCIGGQDINESLNSLCEDMATMIIGTPGRTIDLITRKNLPTRTVQIIIMDEADEILSNNFQHQVQIIIGAVSNTAQICIFSATMPKKMFEVTKLFMNNPEKILVKREKLTLDGIKQFYINVGNDNFKFDTLCDIFDLLSVSQTMVYVNTINRAEYLKQLLIGKKFTVSIIHSKMLPMDRLKIMKDFRSGVTRILVSTDLLSRGIDVQLVSIVINYDLPRDKECYIHRIGRSGRFGRKGVAINFIVDSELENLSMLKDFYKTNIDEMPENVQQFIS